MTLNRLYLDQTQVSDQGLSHLSGLTRLKVLSLRRTTVTSAAVRPLTTQLPDCELRADIAPGDER
jgi:hypothetical protein